MPTPRRLAAVLIAAATIAAACSDSDTDSDSADSAPADAATNATPDDAEASSDGANGAAAGSDADADLQVTVVPTPYSPIAAEALITTAEPTTVQITATSGDHVVEVPATAEASVEHAIPIVGMRQSLDYDLDIQVTDASGESETIEESFTTGEIEWEIPDFELTVDTERAQPGVTVIEYDRWQAPEDAENVGPAVLGIDHEGEVVWFYRNTGVVGAVQPTPAGTFISHYFPAGVREFDVLGNVMANWEVQPEPVEQDLELRDADALAAIAAQLAGNEGDPDPQPLVADWVDLTSIHHEVYPMPNGNFLGLSTTNHELTAEEQEATCPGDDSGFAAVSDVIAEFEPDGTVLRTWDLWDVLEITEIPGSAMCSTERRYESVDFRDWTHANAVIYDPGRDAIIISSRHTDQVIALDHLDDLGPQSSVRWILGAQGTIPLDGEPPYHQHAVELQDDGSILLYDNGNFRPGTAVGDPDAPAYSRAVIYDIDDSSDDPADWTATQVWEHRMDDAQGRALYARFLGDADRLENGNVLIGHGGIDLEDEPANVRIVEVVPDGESGGDIVYDLSFGDADRQFTSYRSERLPSLYFGSAWDR